MGSKLYCKSKKSVNIENIKQIFNKLIITEKTFSKLLPPGDGVLIKVNGKCKMDNYGA